MSNSIFNKSKKSIKFIKYLSHYIRNKKVKAMISLELILVISLLLYVVKKIGTLLYIWIKGFYLSNSIIFLVNNYLDSGMVIETKTTDFNIISGEDKLIIEITKEEDIKIIENALKKENKNKSFKISIVNKKIEIIKEN